MIVILIVMCVLYCIREVCTSALGILSAIDTCIERGLCVECAPSLTKRLFKACFDLCVGLNPLVIILVYLLVQHVDSSRVSTILLSSFALNNSAAFYARDIARQHEKPVIAIDPAQSTVLEVDYIMVVLPFSVSMSLTYAMLSRSIRNGDISQNSTWEEQDMDSSVLAYELAYQFEVMCMNFSMVAASSSEKSLLLMWYSSLLMSLLQGYMTTVCRQSDDCAGKQRICMLCMILYIIIVISVVTDMTQKCTLSEVIALILVSQQSVLVLGPYVCSEKTDIQSVVFMRMCIALVVSGMHVVVLALGRNKTCI